MSALGNVLIVGGGVAGMTLAVALERASIRCEIVEINPDWSVLGVGISLQGPALRALKELGVHDRCVERGFSYSYHKTCDVNGTITGSVELPSLNGPGYPATIGILRQALRAVLAAALDEAQVPIRLGVTVTSLTQDAHSC
jgi:2-polyprenyl-6-methoxyphenol hydroxylase-like FAD-dependent oxidoreductase